MYTIRTLLLALLLACSAGAKAILPLPTVPDSLKTPADRAAYVLNHYWDAMDWQNPTLARDHNLLEENFATYATLFPIVSDSVATEAAASLMKAIAVDTAAYAMLADIADIYLYEPESPVYNESAYLAFLKAILTDSVIEPALMARYTTQYEEASRNIPGSIAADFSFVKRDGKATTLREECAGADKVFLLFYDPDCHDCDRMIHKLLSDSGLSAAVAAGTAKVIAVYPDGIEDVFASGKDKIPAEWTDGYSPEGALVENGEYVVRFTPSLYLLDSGMRVLLKNATVEQALSNFKK